MANFLEQNKIHRSLASASGRDSNKQLDKPSEVLKEVDCNVSNMFLEREQSRLKLLSRKGVASAQRNNMVFDRFDSFLDVKKLPREVSIKTVGMFIAHLSLEQLSNTYIKTIAACLAKPPSSAQKLP